MPEPPAIAVLMPVLDEADRIGRSLDRLLDEDFAEIVVADGGSTDGTPAIVERRGRIRLVRSERGRGTQIGTALAASSSPLILIVHADAILPEHCPSLVRQTLADPRVAAGCFRLAFDRRSRLLDLYAAASRFETRFTTFGDQAYFAKRAAIEAAGGIPCWPLLEDVELRRRLKLVGRFTKRTERVTVSARRFDRLGAGRGQLLNGLILAGYHAGVPVDRLAALYRR